MEYILRTNTVSKKYTNYYAVDKVSISIKKGEIYGLIGENGAGKSTLMKMIAGLVEPSEGSIELFGNFVPQTERYRIGCVIESPALYAELTAKQNLEVFRNAYGLSSKESVQQILKQVGLSQYENKIVKKFSLGMKQRLAIGIVFLIRNSSVSMAVNALLIFFGYLVLHGLESILGLGYNITIFWAISNINKTRIDMAVQWLPTAIIIFFAYMIIFGGVIGTIFKKRDIT